MNLRPAASLLTAAALLLGPGPGCSTVKGFMPGNKPDSNLPPQELIVGGGFQIDYTAPRNGTAVLADRNRGQILITKSMSAGEVYLFNFDPNSPQNAGLFGTGDDSKLSEARPTLYFLPEGYRMPTADGAPAPNPNAPVYYTPPAQTPAQQPAPAQPVFIQPTQAPAQVPAPAANPFDDAAPGVN